MSINLNEFKNIPGSISTEDMDKYNYSIKSECLFHNYHKTKYPELVFDQGYTGICVACSLALIRHIQIYKETGESIIFNPLYIYANRNRSLYTGEGMNTKDALQILQNKGISTTRDITCFDYEESCKKYLLHKQEWDLEAKKYRIKEFHSINTEKDIKNAIYQYGAVTAMIQKNTCLLFPSKQGRESAIITKIRNININGYHQITIIGWLNKHWIIQNSWGEQYGVNGIVYLPMEYPLEEVWCCF